MQQLLGFRPRRIKGGVFAGSLQNSLNFLYAVSRSPSPTRLCSLSYPHFCDLLQEVHHHCTIHQHNCGLIDYFPVRPLGTAPYPGVFSMGQSACVLVLVTPAKPPTSCHSGFEPEEGCPFIGFQHAVAVSPGGMMLVLVFPSCHPVFTVPELCARSRTLPRRYVWSLARIAALRSHWSPPCL